MKISIEIELQADEVDLAKELLSTLRKLTDHVQIKTTAWPAQDGSNSVLSSYKTAGVSSNGSKGSMFPQMEPPFSTPLQTDVKSQQPDTARIARPLGVRLPPPPGMPVPGLPPPASTEAEPLPLTPAPPSSSGSVTPQTAASQAPSHQLPAMPSSQAPLPSPAASSTQQAHQAQMPPEMVTTALKKLMMQLDCSPEDFADKFQTVSDNLSKVLEQSSLGTPQQMFERFKEAFISIIFDSEMVANQKSIVPYMQLIPILPEPFKSDIREPLIGKVMKHLTIPRPVNGNREEFFAQAEAFACLLSLEFVTVQGAVQTLCTLLKDDKKRCAAVTMLGKTAELCADQLKRDCPAHHLDNLRMQMEALEPEFDYDKDYINQCMEWTPATAPNGTAPNGNTGPKPRLTLTTSFAGHTEGIFALAWDQTNQQLASSAKDGSLILWGPQGRQLQRLSAAPGYSYNGLAWAAEQGHIAAVGLHHGATPCIDVYRSDRGSLELLAHLMRSPASLLSSVTILAGTSEFATAMGETSVVCLYDFNSLQRNGEAQPVTTLKGTQDLVTVVAPLGGVPVLLSGAKDGTIAVWDVRQSTVAMTLVGSTRGAHEDSTAMVTTIDSQDTAVIAGCLDNNISKWDLRSLSAGMNSPLASVSVDYSAVLRVAMGGSPGWAAISTISGLYYTDPFDSSLTPENMRAGATAAQHYADVKWGVSEQVLYAGSDQGIVDVYTVS